MRLFPWHTNKGHSAVPQGLSRPFSTALKAHGTDQTRDYDDPDDPLGSYSGDWLPSLDIDYSEKEIVVRAELPGMEAGDIDVSLSNNVLTLQGEKKTSKEEEQEGSYCTECTYGHFRRSIRLREEVHDDDVDASYRNGILTVRLKKLHPRKAKRIKVKTKD